MKVEIIAGQLFNLPARDCPIRRFSQMGNLLFMFAEDPKKAVFYKYPNVEDRAALVTDEYDYYQITNLQIAIDGDPEIVIVEPQKRLCF
jgi:hypothetical protein